MAFLFISVGADVFCEFLEIAVHCILYTRGLYPAGVFEKRKKYNVPVKVRLLYFKVNLCEKELIWSKIINELSIYS